MDITGRKLFVKALLEEGVDTIFAYPGGMVTDIVDELYRQDAIEVVLPRHEQALVHEAEGYARATGKPGICLVTSGPGATNTITAIADAHYDSIPLIIFTGQVPLDLIGNDAFQEVDIVGMTRSITKYGVTVRDRKDLGRIIKMAFTIAIPAGMNPLIACAVAFSNNAGSFVLWGASGGIITANVPMDSDGNPTVTTGALSAVRMSGGKLMKASSVDSTGAWSWSDVAL